MEPPVTDVQSSVWSAIRLAEIHLRSEQSNRFVCDIDSWRGRGGGTHLGIYVMIGPQRSRQHRTEETEKRSSIKVERRENVKKKLWNVNVSSDNLSFRLEKSNRGLNMRIETQNIRLHSLLFQRHNMSSCSERLWNITEVKLDWFLLSCGWSDVSSWHRDSSQLVCNGKVLQCGKSHSITVWPWTQREQDNER